MRAGLGPRSMRFMAVSAAGVIVQVASLVLLAGRLGWGATPATAAAIEVAVLHNFFWHLRWTWAVPRAGLTLAATLGMLGRFHLTNGLVSMATGVGFTRLFGEAFGLHYAASNLLSIGTGALANFAAAEFFVFRVARASDGAGVMSKTQLRAGETACPTTRITP